MAQGSNNRANLKFYGSIAGAGLVVLISSAVFANMDGGPINVAAVITSSNQERALSGDTSAPTPVPKPAGVNDKPFGGLVGQGDAPKPQAQPQPAVEGTTTTSEEAVQEEETASEIDSEAAPEATEAAPEPVDNGTE